MIYISYKFQQVMIVGLIASYLKNPQPTFDEKDCNHDVGYTS